MKHLVRIYFFLGIILAISSCEYKNKNAEQIRSLNATGSFIKDIPERRKTPGLRKAEKFYGLDSLDNGFDSIQIRIWYGCAITGEKLITLSLVGKKWKATLFSREYLDSAISHKTDSMIPKAEIIEPVSGWNELITRLFDMNLLTLPDINKLKGFHREYVMDGCGVAVEIATSRVYRFYQYEDPDLYEEKYSQAGDILNILRFINKEFSMNSDPYHWPEEKSTRNNIDTGRVPIKEIPLELLDSSNKN